MTKLDIKALGPRLLSLLFHVINTYSIKMVEIVNFKVQLRGIKSIYTVLQP